MYVKDSSVSRQSKFCGDLQILVILSKIHFKFIHLTNLIFHRKPTYYLLL